MQFKNFIESYSRLRGNLLQAKSNMDDTDLCYRYLSKANIRAKECLNFIKSHPARQKFLPMRRYLTSISNTIEGTQQSLSDDSSSDIKVYLNRLVDSLPKVSEDKLQSVSASYAEVNKLGNITRPAGPNAIKLFRHMLDKIEEYNKQSLDNDDFDDSIPVVPVGSIDEDASDKVIIAALNQEKKQVDKLPTKKISQSWRLLTLPIAPVAANQMFLSKTKLNSANIQFIMVSGYPILKNQSVLIYNTTTAIEDSGTEEKFVEDAIKTINEQGSEKYAQVSSHIAVNPRCAEQHMVWIMPVRKIRRFVGSGHAGGTFKAWSVL